MYYTNAPIGPRDVWHAFAYQRYKVHPDTHNQFINRCVYSPEIKPELALRKGELLLRGKVIVNIEDDLADDPREMVYRFYVGDEMETEYQLEGYLKDIAGVSLPRTMTPSPSEIKSKKLQRDVERHEVLMHHLLKLLEGPGKTWDAFAVRALSEKELTNDLHPVGMWMHELAVRAEMPVEAVVEYIKARGLVTSSGVVSNRARAPGAYQKDPNYAVLPVLMRAASASYLVKRQVQNVKANPPEWANVNASIIKSRLLVPDIDTNTTNPNTIACKVPTHCPIFTPIKLNYRVSGLPEGARREARPWDARVWRTDRNKPLVPEYTCIMSNLARDCVEAKDDEERMKVLRKAAEEKDPGNVDIVVAALWVMWQRRKV
jgi:hypothetical protein